MKVGNKVLCIKQDSQQWTGCKYKKLNDGPVFKQELFITSIDSDDYLGFAEFPGFSYNPNEFILLKIKEDKLTIKLESKKIIEEINIIQN